MLLLRGQSRRGWEGLDPTFKVQSKDSCKVEDSYLTSYAAIMGGIVDADGRLIHIVRNRHLYKDKTHRRTSGLIRPGSKKCQDENCPTYFGDRNCGVIKTCIECFKEDGELHKYYYGNKSYCSWKLIDGESEKSSDPEEILARACCSLENNNFEHYDLLDNNCEDFALYCSTGRRGEESKQISRLGELKHFVSVVDAILQLRRTDAACGCDVHTCTVGPASPLPDPSFFAALRRFS
ncbi:hypothetical protein AXG93_1403s1030 [Marchantia polymorpha subsp. ruderalis]|uniref:LRAT domain-containing protein n=1 Tax=Marchantia polymorpha subsp. ruderalis TaxID=1480154 RepID=A0A176VIG0_MARPO|nr:hypothetical protein AXG93_1403s1030 [Marchantia polymorpha subsp. ruderalis]